VLELDLTITANQALAECHRRGLVITTQRELAGRPGSSHWHLRIPGHAGTLELSECSGRVSVKVHPRRQGDWAPDLARELAALTAVPRTAHTGRVRHAGVGAASDSATPASGRWEIA
jgi:hypothetical protein